MHQQGDGLFRHSDQRLIDGCLRDGLGGLIFEMRGLGGDVRVNYRIGRQSILSALDILGRIRLGEVGLTNKITMSPGSRSYLNLKPSSGLSFARPSD